MTPSACAIRDGKDNAAGSRTASVVETEATTALEMEFVMVVLVILSLNASVRVSGSEDAVIADAELGGPVILILRLQTV